MKRPYDEMQCIAACQHIARTIVRPLVQRYYRERTAVLEKSDGTIVTDADRAIERPIREFLQQAFPAYGVFGEEYGTANGTAEYVWTVDPLDGTEAFVAGVPIFGTLLGLVQQSEDGMRRPVLGAAYLPVQDRLMIGNRTCTTIDGQPVRMKPCSSTARRTLIVGDISVIARELGPEKQRLLLGVAQRFHSTQTWGDCLGYFNMVEDRAHARIEAGLGVDDIVPLEPIILGAGGAVTTLDAQSLSERLSRLPDLTDASASFVIVSAVDRDLHHELVSSLAP